MEPHNWIYYNGTDHGWNGPDGYIPPVPHTQAFCSVCAPTHIPGFDLARRGTEHHGTGFKCAPWSVGLPCGGCGKKL